MSGHSKWHSIKHKKGAADAKRGRVFTKVIKEITVAARIAGGNPDDNPRLRMAIDKAKEANMPADNIKRAIQKGTGELAGVSYEEITYEGYGPGGAAIMVEVLTDNKNRTVADIRHTFGRHGGNMAGAGAVSFIFDRRGIITVDGATDEEKLMEAALDAGAVDVALEDDVWQVTTEAAGLMEVQDALKAAGITVQGAEVALVPKTTVFLEGKEAEQMLRLMEKLEDHEDVQNVYSNFEVPEELMNEMAE